MPYEQVRSANPNNMGKKSGWCLQNTRLAFGITVGKFASAKADMQYQKKCGTLHPIDTLPTNVSVPVYVDTTSQYEHVILSHYGQFYSDGKKISRNHFNNYFGWGECCDGVRVVRFTNMTSFLPQKGYWALGDKDERIDTLATFMYAVFPKYSPRAVLGDYYGKYLRASIIQFQKNTGLYPDGCVGRLTYAKLQQYGFKG